MVVASYSHLNSSLIIKERLNFSCTTDFSYFTCLNFSCTVLEVSSFLQVLLELSYFRRVVSCYLVLCCMGCLDPRLLLGCMTSGMKHYNDYPEVKFTFILIEVKYLPDTARWR